MLALEYDGAAFPYNSLPPFVLEWISRVFGLKNHIEIRDKYMGIFWEGSEKRSLKAIRDKWNAENPPVERNNRQRQYRGSTQEARDNIELEITQDADVGLVKMLDRLSGSENGTTLDVACEHYERKSVDSIVRYWKTDPKFYAAHLTETCSTRECTGFQRVLILVDDAIPWVKGTTESLNVKKNRKGVKSSLDDYLCSSYGDLPASIEVHCKSCGGSQVTDKNPR
ncbi:hypothetical protein B0J14DRAFT_657946 [Halenospora varia]|nr:hypothetical protein B0J14DRAFT_657946 [Halenospora varia]